MSDINKEHFFIKYEEIKETFWDGSSDIFLDLRCRYCGCSYYNFYQKICDEQFPNQMKKWEEQCRKIHELVDKYDGDLATRIANQTELNEEIEKIKKQYSTTDTAHVHAWDLEKQECYGIYCEQDGNFDKAGCSTRLNTYVPNCLTKINNIYTIK